jgi:quinol monooxygenase YgiN
MIIVAGTFDVAPEHREELLTLAEPLMRGTHAEPGNLDYVLTADRLDPGRVRLFERWETDEALAAHRTQPHVAEFGAALGKLDLRGRELVKYSTSDYGPL